MINAGDHALIVGIAGYVAFITLLGYLFLRWAGVGLRDLLTGREAVLALKIVGIVLMTIMIIMFQNAFSLPEEMFIYGRF